MKAFVGFPLLAALLIAAPQLARASCGTVEVSKGDIKIEAASTKKVSPAPAGSKICSGDTIMAGHDSRAKLKMEDGNELNVSPDSKIVLENYQFNPADNKKKVLLNVLQGKVRATTKQENMYNDKAKDGQANTFQVRTKSAVAGVRGTDFLTGFDAKTQKSEVVTFRGKVEVGQPGPGGTIMNSVSVGAGQKTEAAPGRPPEPPKAVPAKELEKANSDTKADTAGGGDKKSGDAGNSGDKKDDKKSDKKDDGDKADKKDGGDKSGDKSSDKKSDNDKKSDGGGDKKSADAGGDKSGDKKSDNAAGDKKSDPAGGGGDKRADGGSDKGGDKSASNNSGSGNSNGGGSNTGGGRAPASGGGPTAAAGFGSGSSGSGGTAAGSGTSPDVKPVAITAPAQPPPMPASLPPPPMPNIVLPPPMPVIPVIPVCDICNTVVQTGPSKLNVKINVK